MTLNPLRRLHPHRHPHRHHLHRHRPHPRLNRLHLPTNLLAKLIPHHHCQLPDQNCLLNQTEPQSSQYPHCSSY